MKFIISSFLLSIFCLQAMPQEYDHAVVTDVHFTCHTNMISAEQFPMYFHEELFIQDVHAEIRQLIKASFNIDKTVFINPDSILYVYGKTPKKKIDELAPKMEHEVLLIAISTKIQANLSNSSLPRYAFNTRVIAKDRRGKLRYSFKHSQGFMPEVREKIPGKALLAERDFYSFYIQGLQEAFKGENKKTPDLYTEIPHAQEYKDFASHAQKYYCSYTDKALLFGNQANSMRKVLQIDFKFWKEFWGNNQRIEQIMKHDSLNNHFKLTNSFLSKQYEMVLLGKFIPIFNSISIFNIKKLELKEEGLVKGTFLFENSKIANAHFSANNFSFKYNQELEAVEIYSQDVLYALIYQPYEDKIIYLNQTSTEQQLGDFLTLLGIYQIAEVVNSPSGSLSIVAVD